MLWFMLKMLDLRERILWLDMLWGGDAASRRDE